MKIRLHVSAVATAAVLSCTSEPSLIQCDGATPRADGLYECNEVLVRKEAPSCPVAPPVGPGNSPACTSDADCSAGSACYCGELIHEAERDPSQGLCVPAGCRTNAECEDGEYCVVVYLNEVNYESEADHQFRCTTSKDECHQSDDCVGGSDICVFSPTANHLICEEAVLDG
jgi:hypothetical protein